LLVLFPILFFLSPPTSAEPPPTAFFVETFEHYEFADGARTTAWWDRSDGRLTLRQADAGHTRRWPSLAATEAGGMTSVWVEDRGQGPIIWAQTLDRHGNRLWDADLALLAWQGNAPETPPESHPIALSPAQTGGYWLIWGDETGVWANRWSGESGLTGPRISISADLAVDVTSRCQGDVCGVVWNTDGSHHLALFTAEGTVTPLKESTGAMQIAWGEDGDLWVAWRDSETTQIAIYDSATLLPVWDPPLIIDENSSGPLDLVATNQDVWIILDNPLQVSWLRETGSGLPPVHEKSWLLAETAAQARITAMPNRVSMVWQTDDPPAFWARWIGATGDPLSVDARLLRLGLVEQLFILGDIATTSDASTGVIWMENDQVYARRWEGDGRSFWRHEVAPAYAPAPGWVVSEGLAHSLPVNQPWQGVTAATLDANIALNGGSVQFYVSNQGPRDWRQIEPGQKLEFNNRGNELRWYARLRRSPWGTAPEIQEVSLEYTYSWLQNLAFSQRQHQR